MVSTVFYWGPQNIFNFWGEEEARLLYALRGNAVVASRFRRKRLCEIICVHNCFVCFLRRIVSDND